MEAKPVHSSSVCLIITWWKKQDISNCTYKATDLKKYQNIPKLLNFKSMNAVAKVKITKCNRQCSENYHGRLTHGPNIVINRCKDHSVKRIWSYWSSVPEHEANRITGTVGTSTEVWFKQVYDCPKSTQTYKDTQSHTSSVTCLICAHHVKPVMHLSDPVQHFYWVSQASGSLGSESHTLHGQHQSLGQIAQGWSHQIRSLCSLARSQESQDKRLCNRAKVKD